MGPRAGQRAENLAPTGIRSPERPARSSVATPTDLPGPHVGIFNLLKPTCYVMHHQFNIQQLYALPTLYLCVLYLSENKQRLVPLTASTDWFL